MNEVGRVAARLLLGLVVAIGLAPGALAQSAAPSATPAPSPAPRQPFAEWLEGVRAEALSLGIRQETIDEALGHLDEPVSSVLDRDRSQAELVLPLEVYISQHLKGSVVDTARKMASANQALLDQVAARYGVPPSIIVAVWGLESNFGRFSGVRPTISALATLAWDPRRAAFFRGELLSALQILDHGDIDLAHMRGSWAGAMGQSQFMPSSYLKFAEDFDGDGRRDIWSTQGDVFASIANYLKGRGWKPGETWGREVQVPRDSARRISAEVAPRNGTCQATRDMTVVLPAKTWHELGVRLPGGGDLPDTTPDAAMVSGATKHFLVYGNYDALLEYNCAHSYAISVGLLADSVDGRPAAPPRAPSKRRRLRR